MSLEFPCYQSKWLVLTKISIVWLLIGFLIVCQSSSRMHLTINWSTYLLLIDRLGVPELILLLSVNLWSTANQFVDVLLIFCWIPWSCFLCSIGYQLSPGYLVEVFLNFEMASLVEVFNFNNSWSVENLLMSSFTMTNSTPKLHRNGN